MVIGVAGKSFKPPQVRTWGSRAVGLLIAVYGIYAFIKRDLPNYILLRNRFAFFDFSEPIALFLLDYLAIMGLFVWGGHYLSQLVKKPINWENWHRK